MNGEEEVRSRKSASSYYTELSISTEKYVSNMYIQCITLQLELIFQLLDIY